jgi:N-acetylglucosaminyldiphosphoundecaprenol N-acetyl-beta-D-mannosaminyltransferase
MGVADVCSHYRFLTSVGRACERHAALSVPPGHVVSVQIQRFNVLGVPLTALDLRLATEAVLDCCRSGRKGYVCVTGMHGISEAQRDEAFRRVLSGALLNTTDGMPLVWLGRQEVGRWVDRVYGPDLMLEMFRATQDGMFSHFLYGGIPGVAETLKHRLEARFPGVRIVGTHCPPFGPLSASETRALVEKVAAAKPDLFWVGLSTPKQEVFMAEHLPTLRCGVMLGVGAAFDFHSGRVKQAPRWVQRSGFEWLYRLSREPRRLWKRYCVNVPLFLARVALQKTGLREYPLVM